MPANSDYIFLPKFSLEPNKCSSFNEVYKKSNYNSDGTKKAKIKRLINGNIVNNVIKRSSHNLELSDNAYRTLKRKINWLYYLSKARYVKSYNGREIFNFKIGFVTLTLSSVQKHCTKDITNLLFNQFLTEVRQRTNMTNYVWRLEFQKNGNVHYHLVTDTYLDYFFVQKIWNRIQESHGYIQDYQDKHKGMTLNEYYQAYKDDKHNDFNKLAKRYAKGCQSNWSNPPSVDVKSVISKKAIANYISKYFSKDDSGVKSNILDNEDNSSNLRIWFCSRSLSKLSSVSDYCEAVEYDIFSVVKTCKEIKKYVGRYAMVYYYELKELPQWSRMFIEKLLRGYAYQNGYVSSS